MEDEVVQLQARLERRNCQALGECGRWSFIELMACAIHGPCGPERLSQSMFAPDDRERARGVADAWTRAAADPAACDRHCSR